LQVRGKRKKVEGQKVKQMQEEVENCGRKILRCNMGKRKIKIEKWGEKIKRRNSDRKMIKK
jgi:hypothetical protein